MSANRPHVIQSTGQKLNTALNWKQVEFWVHKQPDIGIFMSLNEGIYTASLLLDPIAKERHIILRLKYRSCLT